MMDMIEQLYGIKVKSIQPFVGGFSSNSWILSDIRDRRFFLKEMPFKDKNRTAFLNKVQSYLCNYKLSIPILLTKNGSDQFVVNQQPFVLYQYVPGEKLEKIHKKEDAFFWGTYLGKIHQLLYDYNDTDTWRGGISIKKPQISILNELLASGKVYGTIKDIVEYKKYRLENQLYRVPEIRQWNMRIIHGDFYLNNLIKYEENIFLIDFENTSYFYQEYELMRAAIMISDFQFDETDSYNIIIYLITFIKGYLKYGRLQCDFCDLVDFYDYMLLNDLYYLTGNEKEKDILFLQRRYAISKWLYLYGNLLKKFLKEEFVK